MITTEPRVHPAYIVAEMACSHEGDRALARVIIDGAGQAGADAIQFQIWTARDMIVPQHADFGLVCGLELSRVDWTALAVYARERYPAMQIIACVYEPGSVDFAESLQVDAYKLHTADLSNPYLVRHVAKTGKRIDLSVGASTIDEIQEALGWIAEVSSAPVWLMYGYQNFPTRIDDVHLRYLVKLRDLFERRVGYQDHTDAENQAGFWIPAAALGLGIDVLEKHITHDRSKRGVDHQAALNPDEFAQFVAMVRQVEAALGSGIPKPFSADAQRYRRYSKKSIVAARDLEAGQVLGAVDLLFMRTGKLGLPPADAPLLLNRPLARRIAKFELLTVADVA